MDMYREVQHFSQEYKLKQQNVPDSIQYKGYLGWKPLPTWVKHKFPSLQHITQIEFRHFKLERADTVFGPPQKLVYVVAQPLHDGKIFYLVRHIILEEYLGIVSDRVKRIMLLTVPIGLVFYGFITDPNFYHV